LAGIEISNPIDTVYWAINQDKKETYMSKNLTRKGLALGAVVALGSTLFAGAPAFAIDQITIAPNAGTSLNILQGQTFVLKTDIATTAGTAARLKYKLTNADGRGITTTSDNQGNASYSNTTAIVKFDGSTAVSVTSGKATGTEQVITPAETGVTAYSNLLTLASDYTDGNTAVSVQAFIDENQNGLLDSTENSTAATTVTFYKETNVTATTVLTPPVVGDTTLVATTTTVPELNGALMAANALHVAFTAQGNANAAFAENTTTNGSTMGTNTWVAADKNWVSTAHLGYSLTGDGWNGTDAAWTDVNLATAIAAGQWYYGNDNAATTHVFSNDGTSGALGDLKAHSLTTSAQATHYAFFGVKNNADPKVAIAAANFIATKAATDFTTDSAKSITVTTTGLTAENANDTRIGEGTLRALVAGTNAAVVAGTYSARAYTGTTALAAAATTNSPATPVATEGTLETVATANVQPKSDDTGSVSGQSYVRSKTTSVDFVYTVNSLDTVTNTNTKNPGAGIDVTVALSLPGGSGTYKINGKSSPVVLKTDANGVVKFSVTETAGLAAADVVVTATAEGQTGSAAQVKLDWVDATYALFDTKVQDGYLSYRTVEAGGSYTIDFALLDQWGVGADGTKYRLLVSAADRTVSSKYETLSANGTVSVAIADSKLGSNAYIRVTAAIEIKAADGTWGAYNSSNADWDGTNYDDTADEKLQINVIADQNDAIVLDADAGTTYDYKNAGTAADLSDVLAAKAVVAQNRFTSQAAQLAYANFVTVNGRVQNSLTGLARGGSTVTISGASNILFSVGKVDALGSITTIADASGLFTVNLASNVAQKDSVITITTPDAGSKTIKVTFAPALPDTATKVDFTGTTDKAASGSTFAVIGTLKDVYGNVVDTKQDVDANTTQGADSTNESAKLTVTYVGPGIVFGDLPVETNSKGQFRFAVLVGSADAGFGEVTVEYDSNGDGDTTDLNEFSATKSVLIGISASVSAGKKAATAVVKGALGGTVTVVSGTKSVTKVATSNNFKLSLTKLTAGKKTVKVYVNDVLVSSKSVTVKK
jgi:hypothetical protein